MPDKPNLDEEIRDRLRREGILDTDPDTVEPLGVGVWLAIGLGAALLLLFTIGLVIWWNQSP